MSARWLGVVVSSDKITFVDVFVPDTGPIDIQGDHTWPLQKGDRALSYDVMHQQLRNYVREKKIDKVVVKGSAVSLGGTTKNHLEAAELRGVILSAAASSAETIIASKAHISRTFGNRKVDEYLSDAKFWSDEVTGESLRVGSREAAMILLAARKNA